VLLPLNVLTKLLLASVVAASFAACVPCDSEVTQHGLAPRPQYDTQIDACITKHSCLPLCRSVFQLDGSYDVRSCKIELVDAANAHVVVRYNDNSCSSSDDGDVIAGDDGSYDDGGYTDDGSDDGSTDDGSDDGSTDDGSDDGSTTGDDGSSDGGDDGGDSGGDDGGYRVHSHESVKSLTTPNPRQ